MMSKKAEEKEEGVAKFLLLAVSFLILPIVGGLLIARYSWSQHVDWSTTGQRGDFWGGHFGPWVALAGSLLLFLAIIVQVAQLKTQQQELKAQREDLKATREELEQTREVHKLQLQLAKDAGHASSKYAFFNHAIAVNEYAIRIAEHRNEFFLKIHSIAQHQKVDVDATLNDLDNRLALLNQYILEMKHDPITKELTEHEQIRLARLLQPYKS